MNIELKIQSVVAEALKELYDTDIPNSEITVQNTRKDFEGDYTLVVFPFLKYSKKSPTETAGEIGNFVKSRIREIESFNILKGFLNLSLCDNYWVNLLLRAVKDKNYGIITKRDDPKLVMVEYSSPNTNKPLHLGHIRNNLLGYSLSEILKANGHNVVKTNIVNDRGIHICKSMLAWQKWGKGTTPGSTGKKGDHFVGDLYVEFDKRYKEEIEKLTDKGFSKKEAEENAPLILEARELLRKWEAGDEETVKLWKTMNEWVYEGFNVTYKKLGVDFDKIYYESDTYIAGRDEVLSALEKGIFYRKEDGSVWADLTDNGLDHKLLLRSDGTSVYMTQDIGTAKMRFIDYDIDQMIYVVGNEQNYHFEVLAILLDKLGYEWGSELYHFSYGMVELPSGKMKSREGTVVDADELIADMENFAEKMSQELGKIEQLTPEEAEKNYEIIALGALKYFILKVDPKKNMLFNPEESIDFNGNTGTFIQYTYARIQSVLRKAAEKGIDYATNFRFDNNLSNKEKDIIKRVSMFPDTVKESGSEFSPALIANYCYELVKEYNQFYQDHSILHEPETLKRNLRLVLSSMTGQIIKRSMHLLGILVPERM